VKGAKSIKAGAKDKVGWRKAMDIAKHMARRWSEEGKILWSGLLPFLLPLPLGSVQGFPCALLSQPPHHYSRELLDESKTHLR